MNQKRTSIKLLPVSTLVTLLKPTIQIFAELSNNFHNPQISLLGFGMSEQETA